jgi:hypothetical protein
MTLIGTKKALLEYLTEAAELGDALTHHFLSACILMDMVLRRIRKKKDTICIWEERLPASGHTDARYNLAVIEENKC